MEVGRKKRKGPKMVEMPQVDFDLEGIREIQKRKEKIYKRGSKINQEKEVVLNGKHLHKR